MGFSVIIVDYKSIEKTIEYIEHCNICLKHRNTIKYIIVDNDDTLTGLNIIKNKNECKKICIIDTLDILEFKQNGINIVYVATGENTGYAKGNNLGARISNKLYPENHYLFSNNDLFFPHEYSLDEVENYLESGYALVAPDIVSQESHLNPIKIEGLNYLLYWQYIPIISKIAKRNEIETTYSGCFWFFERDNFNRIGGFDEGTFLYFEEYIMAEKIKKNSNKVIYYPQMRVVHNHNYMTLPVDKAIWFRKVFFESGLYYEKKYKNISKFNQIIKKILFEITIHVLFIPARKVYSLINS